MKESEYTEDIIGYLTKALEYYKSLLPLAKMQKDILASEDYNKIDAVIDEKAKLIEKIKALDRRFSDIKNGISNFKYNKIIKDLSIKLTEIIQYLIKIENESRNIMLKNKDKVKNRLYTIHRGRKMLSVYSSANRNIAKFIDIKR